MIVAGVGGGDNDRDHVDSDDGGHGDNHGGGDCCCGGGDLDIKKINKRKYIKSLRYLIFCLLIFLEILQLNKAII